MKMNQMTLNRGHNMAKSDRRKKSNKECTIDIARYNERVRLFIQSSDKVFEQLNEWGCKWTDVSIGVLDNMQESYEALVSAKKQKEKEYVASNIEGVWTTTTHTHYYEDYST